MSTQGRLTRKRLRSQQQTSKSAASSSAPSSKSHVASATPNWSSAASAHYPSSSNSGTTHYKSKRIPECTCMSHASSRYSSSSCPRHLESLPEVTTVTITRSKSGRGRGRSDSVEHDTEQHLRDVRVNHIPDEDCVICMENLKETSGFLEDEVDRNEGKKVVKLVDCEHIFHKLCIMAMCQKETCVKCPCCNVIYGVKHGNCPPGKMQWQLLKDMSVPGYEGYNVLHVLYSISHGIQEAGDPNPGTQYYASGFPRQGFIPDCDKGRKVLKLLMEAFRRKLMFTIGTSITTGRPNSVVWNEIHLKTEAQNNYYGHGYPDPNYLDNVLLELACHGVREEDVL